MRLSDRNGRPPGPISGLAGSVKLYRYALSVLLLVLPRYAHAAPALTVEAVISGVPFVSWVDAARSDYDNRTFVNPSMIAADRMIKGYRSRIVAPAKLGEGADRFSDRDDLTAGKQATTEDLKRWIADGVAVYVQTSLTPYAHPVRSSVEVGVAAGMHGGLNLGPQGQSASALGRMVSTEALRAMPDSIRSLITCESVTGAARVVVAYDDRRRTFLIHDPSFGPGWEVGYAEFETMCALADHRCAAPSPSLSPPSPPVVSSYPPATGAQKAALALAYGYALSSTGRLAEGERELTTGAGVARLSQGYRYLLLCELALNYGAQDRINEAVQTARQATEAISDDPDSWNYLATTYPMSSLPQRQSPAEAASRRAKLVASDPKAEAHLADLQPNDFWIPKLAPLRGRATGCGFLPSTARQSRVGHACFQHA